ncbi:MAG: universal stress protein [bacterium]|nr:universal stress protein [bacterium]
MPWSVQGPIVVPFDFSDHARQAIHRAVEIAEQPNHVHVLHVLPFMIPTDPGAVWDTVDDQSRIDHARQALAETLPTSQFGNLQLEVQLGDPGRVITEFAEGLHADLVIVGSHGRTGFSRLLLGSVAEKVTRLVHCPVLVLKLPAEPVKESQPVSSVRIAPA